MLKSCLPYLGPSDCIEIKEKNKNNGGNNYESKSSWKWKEELEEAAHNSNNFPSSSSDQYPSFGFESSSSSSKHIFVRVVHAGGKVDHYPKAVLASKLLEKIPSGKWLTRPEVFKHPHDSVICPEEYLLPGHKYYVMPLSTIHKLKRKHHKIMSTTANNNNSLQLEPGTSSSVLDNMEFRQHSNHDHQITSSSGDDDEFNNNNNIMEEGDREEDGDYCSFSSASDFYLTTSISSGNNNVNDNGGSSTILGTGSSSGSIRRPAARILLPVGKPKALSGYTWEPGLPSIRELSP